MVVFNALPLLQWLGSKVIRRDEDAGEELEV